MLLKLSQLRLKHMCCRSDEHVPIHYVKIVVLGDTGVGKTSIIQVKKTKQYIKNTPGGCSLQIHYFHGKNYLITKNVNYIYHICCMA